MGLIPGPGAKMLHDLWPKTQTIKQQQQKDEEEEVIL